MIEVYMVHHHLMMDTIDLKLYLYYLLEFLILLKVVFDMNEYLLKKNKICI